MTRDRVILVGDPTETTPDLTAAAPTEGDVLTVVSGVPAFATPTSLTAASTVTDETTFGIATAVGVSTAYARQDHTHGSPANPVTAVAVQAVGHYELLMAAGISSPPEPLDDGTGTDWLYVWVTP